MKSVDDHLADCLAAVVRPAPVERPLLDSLDCLLAHDVVSTAWIPPFDNSAMDGYAVRVSDVAGADVEQPVVIDVSLDIPAGATENRRLEPGTVARIMTGAPLPPGTEAIVPVEWTDGGRDRVEIRRVPSAGDYLRRRGEDVEPGRRVLSAGVRLNPRRIAVLAALGQAKVSVYPRPRVLVLSTGSELVAPGASPRFGEIYDANGYGLTAAALDLGAEARYAGIVADDADQLAKVLGGVQDTVERVDLVITSGGVSAGAYDTVKEFLTRLGTVTFDKVAMQPGMPQGFGVIGSGVPIFTLPGNPVSAMVSFEVFVRPVLRSLAGEEELHRPRVVARAGVGWRSPRGKRQFVRAELLPGADPDVAPTVRPVGGQGSHLIADLAAATCLAVVPEDVTEVREGDEVSCMPLDRGRR